MAKDFFTPGYRVFSEKVAEFFEVEFSQQTWFGISQVEGVLTGHFLMSR